MISGKKTQFPKTGVLGDFPGFLFLLTFLAAASVHAEPYSPFGGFRIDLPPGYQERALSGTGQLSFSQRQGAVFELDLGGTGGDPVPRLETLCARLGSGTGDPGSAAGEIEAFDYHGRRAALVRLEFSLDASGRPRSRSGGTGRWTAYQGWALCVDRGEDQLLALAYGPAGNTALELLGLSCLDSIAPTPAEQYYWGPVTEFAWPRGEPEETALYNTGITALIAPTDAEAAQGLVDREFQVLRQFEGSAQWQEAWRRFYRMIRRDSWERLADAFFQLERSWNAQAMLNRAALRSASPSAVSDFDDYALAAKALSYVQNFRYERDLM
ncbi:MAG: hypothetical protein LBF63_09955, partial [Treponema sp.]|nr:hypothetical protein [Treponema sp.]